MNDTFMKEKPILGLVLSMSLPMVLSMLVNSLYNIVDSYFVASISEEAMTALSLVYPIQNLINAITIGFGVGINATTLDIVENPKNLDIVELEAAQIPSRLADVDMAVINGNYALDAGLKVADALAIEAADGTAAQAYENVIAVKEGNENNEAIKALVEALQSDTIRDYINDTYNGAVVPMF